MKRKPIKLRIDECSYSIMEWIGPIKPNKQYKGYLRLESFNGEYIGSPNDRQLRTLQRWLNSHFKGNKNV